MLWFRIKGTSPFSSSYYRNGLKNTNIFFLYLSKIGVHVWDTCDCILKWPVLQMGTYIVFFLLLNQLNSSIQCKIKKKSCSLDISSQIFESESLKNLTLVIIWCCIHFCQTNMVLRSTCLFRPRITESWLFSCYL